MVYSNTCLLGKSPGKESKYIGETARTMLERNKEHQRDALASKEALKSKTSHIRSTPSGSMHPREVEEILDIFRMDLIESASTVLERQVREAVEIRRVPQGHLLNLKEEYNIVVEGRKPIKEQEQED